MTETEKAYLAGIIDGEGSIALTNKHKGRLPSPQLNVSNNNLELLKYIQDITKCDYIREKKDQNRIIADRIIGKYNQLVISCESLMK